MIGSMRMHRFWSSAGSFWNGEWTRNSSKVASQVSIYIIYIIYPPLNYHNESSLENHHHVSWVKSMKCARLSPQSPPGRLQMLCSLASSAGSYYGNDPYLDIIPYDNRYIYIYIIYTSLYNPLESNLRTRVINIYIYK
jgi:hypothetical protein